MTSRFVTSSWVHSLAYVRYGRDVTPPVAGTHGFLVVTTRAGRSYAYAVPSWVVGILMATYVRQGHIGRMLNRLVIGKWPSVKVESGA